MTPEERENKIQSYVDAIVKGKPIPLDPKTEDLVPSKEQKELLKEAQMRFHNQFVFNTKPITK